MLHCQFNQLGFGSPECYLGENLGETSLWKVGLETTPVKVCSTPPRVVSLQVGSRRIKHKEYKRKLFGINWSEVTVFHVGEWDSTVELLCR